MGGKRCGVCSEAQYKYKCPSCLLPYCSLPCFKKHKEIPCSKSLPSDPKPGESSISPLIPGSKSLAYDAKPSESSISASPVLLSQRSFQVVYQSQALKKEQLESLAISSEIRDALKNEELQKLIRKIDSSADAENELDKAMEGEIFCAFADKILSIITQEKQMVAVDKR